MHPGRVVIDNSDFFELRDTADGGQELWLKPGVGPDYASMPTHKTLRFEDTGHITKEFTLNVISEDDPFVPGADGNEVYIGGAGNNTFTAVPP